MRVSELKGRSVLDITQATEVATVQSVIIDADTGRVVGFRVKGDAPVLPFDSVKAVGEDRVTVEGSALHEPRTDAESRAVESSLEPLGSRVLADSGTDIGVLDDIEIDPSDGSITAIHVGPHDLPGDALLGVGSYAVVVRAP